MACVCRYDTWDGTEVTLAHVGFECIEEFGLGAAQEPATPNTDASQSAPPPPQAQSVVRAWHVWTFATPRISDRCGTRESISVCAGRSGSGAIGFGMPAILSGCGSAKRTMRMAQRRSPAYQRAPALPALPALAASSSAPAQLAARLTRAHAHTHPRTAPHPSTVSHLHSLTNLLPSLRRRALLLWPACAHHRQWTSS